MLEGWKKDNSQHLIIKKTNHIKIEVYCSSGSLLGVNCHLWIFSNVLQMHTKLI